MVSYSPVNLNQHKSEALVVHCCDPRFQEAYRQAAEQVSNFYDLMAVPGASKAIVDDPNVIKNIKMLHGLHDFSEVHIMDHVECGAFGKIDDEVDSHSKYIHLAIQTINKALPEVKVIPHLLGANAEIKLKVPA
jgi:carbonic anhydrase